MSLNSADTPLEEIDQIYDRLQARFASHATHEIDYRLYNLKQLAYMLMDNADAIRQSLMSDLGKGESAVNLEELYPMINEINLAVSKLPKWMKDEGRAGDALWILKGMKPRVKKQPRGVALIIGPWNYPWQCVIIPLIGAISAGCPAILKPSEMSPATATLMAQLIPRYLDPEGYAVVLGAVEQTTKLLEKKWGHILFTGSTRVGKIVATAAAKTLTTTTLELGGKSPVIVTASADVEKSARRLLSMKQLGIGQLCVSPDYVLCDRSRVDEFIAALIKTLEELWPKSPHPQSFLHCQTSAALRGEPEFKRQMAFVDEAEKLGRLVYRGESDPDTRRMGVSIVKMDSINGNSARFLEEEIFGPIIPVVPVNSLDEAISYVNSRPNPLTISVCTTKDSEFQRVCKETITGSAIKNDFVLAVGSRNLPFGGVGDSGWGNYHGYDGFKTFSHTKSVIDNPLFVEMPFRYPPMTEWKTRLSRFLFFYSGIAFKRPTSVEAEKSLRLKTKIVKWVTSTLVLVVLFGMGAKLRANR